MAHINKMEELDEEDYWGTSNVKKSIKSKDIFADSVTIDDASMLAKYRRDLDIEKINWDDTPVTDSAGAPKQSVSNDPVLSASQVYKAHNRSRSDVQPVKHAIIEKSPSLTGNLSGSSLEASLSQVTDYQPRRGSQASDKDQQIQFLQDRLKKAENSIGASKLKVAETVKRMITGQAFSLESYKSKEEKIELLDRAIKTHDGNAIITVVIFLKKTLSDQIFYYELTKRPDAVDQYLSYLKAHFNTRELEYMLEKLDRAEEIAIMRYRQAASVEDPDTKINRLEQCLRAHFDHSLNLDHDAGLIRQQVSLLKRQRPVDVGDDMIEKQGKHIVFRALPRTRPITNLPVITTLFYCCIYHYEEPDNLLSSPQSIKKDHQLTEKQFVWTALRARAKMKKWADIDGLFTTKGWLGGTKMKAIIGFDKVAAVLYRFEAQSTVLCKYLLLIDDVDKRLELAKKMKSHKAIIETYAALRDRRSLEMYQRTLKVNSEEWFYCRDMLSSNNIKWKS